MISGIIKLEDRLITFTEVELNKITYIIWDNLKNIQETKTVKWEDFMAALGIALSCDGGDYATVRDWNMAERAQPDNTELRFIP